MLSEDKGYGALLFQFLNFPITGDGLDYHSVIDDPVGVAKIANNIVAGAPQKLSDG
jgi:hypothetical protein